MRRGHKDFWPPHAPPTQGKVGNSGIQLFVKQKIQGKIVVLVTDGNYDLECVAIDTERAEELRTFLQACPRIYMDNFDTTLGSAVSDIKKAAIEGIVSKIDCQIAQCGPADRIVIHGMIERNIGFDAFNHRIHLALQESIMETESETTEPLKTHGKK